MDYIGVCYVYGSGLGRGEVGTRGGGKYCTYRSRSMAFFYPRQLALVKPGVHATVWRGWGGPIAFSGEARFNGIQLGNFSLQLMM